MVIELRGVQFGLKSYVGFQNQTSAKREFDLKSQVWFRTKIARPEVELPLYHIHFVSISLAKKKMRFRAKNSAIWE